MELRQAATQAAEAAQAESGSLCAHTQPDLVVTTYDRPIGDRGAVGAAIQAVHILDVTIVDEPSFETAERGKINRYAPSATAVRAQLEQSGAESPCVTIVPVILGIRGLVPLRRPMLHELIADPDGFWVAAAAIAARQALEMIDTFHPRHRDACQRSLPDG